MNGSKEEPMEKWDREMKEALAKIWAKFLGAISK